jgi:hypothetical protein
MINFRHNSLGKIKSFKKDIAPIGFYFDIFPTDFCEIPILPLPLRIDKISNGEPTVIITPNFNQIHTLCKKLKLTFDPQKFYFIGIKNLINYAKLKIKEITLRDLTLKNVTQWWELSKDLIAWNPDLLDSFTLIILEFIKVFNYINENKSDQNQKDYTNVLLKYYTQMIDYFRNKIENNIFITYYKDEVKEAKLYFEKRNKFYPNIVNIQIYNKKNKKFKAMGFVPYLIYDDLLDCFFYNKNLLEQHQKKAINLKVYEDNLIIKKGSTLSSSKNYLRTTRINKLDINILIDSINL